MFVVKFNEYFTLTAASAGAATAPWKRAARAMTVAKKAENCMLRLRKSATKTVP
jgi:hypothetical protein